MTVPGGGDQLQALHLDPVENLVVRVQLDLRFPLTAREKKRKEPSPASFAPEFHADLRASAHRSFGKYQRVPVMALE
jgi:hypothetical protein